jgi:phosphatidylinositol alpha-1,6-mannosyltransferase
MSGTFHNAKRRSRLAKAESKAEARSERSAAAPARERTRVLVLTPDFPPAHGGIQRLMHGLVRHWQNVDARVLTLDGPGAREFDRNEPIDIRRINSPRALGHKGAVVWLNTASVGEARRFRPHAVLSGHIVTSPAAWFIRRTLNVPVIQYLHLSEVNTRPKLAAFAIRKASGVVAVSRRTAFEASARGAAPSKLHLIPPGVAEPTFATAAQSLRPIIVTVSRLHDAYKGHDVVIQALPLVLSRVPDVRWVVIGDGRLRQLYERSVYRLGLRDHVQFLGAVNDCERDAWLDRAHVFVMPNRIAPSGPAEGFGIVFLEAAAHGLPVVAGNVDGAVDAVVDGETGLLVDPTDVSAVARALIDLLLDRNRAKQMGRAGRERARGFTWDRVAAQVEKLLIQARR